MKQDLTPRRRIQRQRHILHKRLIVLGLNAIKHLQHANEKEHCLRECEFLCRYGWTRSASFRKQRKEEERRMGGNELTPDTEPRATAKRYKGPTGLQTLLPPLGSEFVGIFAVDVFPSVHSIHVNVDI